MKEQLNSLTEAIIASAIAVHHALGPGMLESAYDACLAYELLERGLRIERQKPMPLVYRGQLLDIGYRLDLLVEDLVVVEVKGRQRLRSRSHRTAAVILTACRM